MPAITVEGTRYWVDPKKCTIDGRWADHGIGPYEFWGARSVHVDIQFEIETVEVEEAEDEEDNPIKDRETLKKIEDAIAREGDQEWSELANNYEPDYDPEPDHDRDE